MKVGSYCDVVIGDYPEAESFARELQPILENETVEEIDKNFSPPSIQGEINSSVVQHEFWGNVYGKGDYADPHHHSPNAISLVYFLKSKWYFSPLVFSDFGEKVDPIEGKYVLFPSHILHHVPVHKFDQKRITLSSNFSIVMPPIPDSAQ